MKKLRFFDSLKFVLATVACVFILNVAHAATTAIQSVIAYGKTEQSATPTPTNPVPIMTNNGVLKASKNLFDDSLFDTATGTTIVYRSFSIPNGIYTMSTNFTAVQSNGPKSNVFIFAGRVSSGANSSVNGVYSTQPRTITVTDGYYTVAYRSAISNGSSDNPKNFDWMLEKGSTATAYEPYGTVIADGLTETIRDSAGHTATAQMLLSVGDYKDEQNITTGAITRKVGVKVFDGTEDWQLVNSTQNNVYDAMRVTLSSVAPDAKNNLSIAEQLFAVKCTHLELRVVNTFNGGVSGLAWATRWFDSTPRVAIRVAGITTVEQFKSWLAEQYANGTPVIVVYPLATETTETVATQQMTTAPVRQTAGSILGMPIEVVLGDGTREWVSEIITIATTKYNEESFAPVKTDLSAAVNAVEYVVSNTMSQAQAIDQIANEKQTRPDEGCMAKYCLLVEDEDGTPHWYPIAGANGVAHNLPAGYTELQYIESTGTQYIDTGLKGTQDTKVVLDFQLSGYSDNGYILGSRTSRDSNAFMIGANDGRFNSSGDSFPFAQFDSVSPTMVQQEPNFDLNRHIYELSSGGFYIDGVLYRTYSNPTNFSTPENITLFGRYSAGNFAYGIFRAYGLKLYNGNNLVRDLIPARNSSDVVGMYDLVSGQFFTNAGTGTFVAGPDM